MITIAVRGAILAIALLLFGPHATAQSCTGEGCVPENPPSEYTDPSWDTIVWSFTPDFGFPIPGTCLPSCHYTGCAWSGTLAVWNTSYEYLKLDCQQGNFEAVTIPPGEWSEPIETGVMRPGCGDVSGWVWWLQFEEEYVADIRFKCSLCAREPE